MLSRIVSKIVAKLRKPSITYVKAEIKQSAVNSSLVGKRILITGGTKGIGLAMAKRFMKEGAQVIITGREESTTRVIATEIGCDFITLNLQNISSVESIFVQTTDKFGQIDCLVNNAGISLHEPSFFDVTPETFEKQFCTNLEGPFFLTQCFVKYLIDKHQPGNVLFISSETGFTADIRPYGLSKAALNSLVQGLANSLVKNNIRVNAIAPGVVATAMTGNDHVNNLSYPFNSIGRLYLPEEIAEVGAYLLSDASYCISGQIIGCNNARTINARWK